MRGLRLILSSSATYLQLDTDHNGMLSKDELSQINNGTLTQLFVDRIFEEFRMYRSETGKSEMVLHSLSLSYFNSLFILN